MGAEVGVVVSVEVGVEMGVEVSMEEIVGVWDRGRVSERKGNMQTTSVRRMWSGGRGHIVWIAFV